MAAPMVTPLDAGAAAAAYNATHTRLAVADLAGRLSLWQRTEGSAGGWTLASSLPAEGLRITSLCWAPKEFGGVLAGGASDGSVAVWQEAPGDGAWRLAAVLKEGALGVQDLAFAPPELGPLVAAAYADGAVRFFEASAVLAADSWELQNYFRLGRAAGAATALSWRQPAPGLPPLLVVGTAAAGAQVWAYRRQLMRWEQEATLGGPTEAGGRSVADVAWAPTLGRPYDIVAVAAGPAVTLWRVMGAADSLEVEQLTRLQHAAEVWQVEWNLLGSWLAASTDAGDVCLWRPDLGGEWLLLNRVVGEQQAAA
ncbi:Nucleoporin seh1-A [Micractinium conductrix]|uniref:Nucleoporin seh1-A n=1 Tax=Micractinium conductrix TaxID=554055 RepID=A0A2P6V959_9CHLO|nr:Nucleoporin seh1-A [Micractinium conductrix]|eukprot:PSC70623.1 Nucleoporin seh1-A [Micractinium conductrix]